MSSLSKYSPMVVAALIERGWQYMGVDYSGDRANDLIRRLEHLGEDLGIVDIPAWLGGLARNSWKPTQIDELTPAYTVGETYFGRDPGTLSWLRDKFFPKLISERRATQNLVIRCWSAGCCTGEEVYGVIFLLEGLLGEDFLRWDIQVVGTDINKNFLERAQQGVYGASALRVSSADFKEKYFERSGRKWAIKQPWTRGVRFSYFNLAASIFESPLQSCDVILCRNVLMYLLPHIAKNAVKNLYQNLAPEGVLLIGAVDASLATDSGFKGIWTQDNLAIGPNISGCTQFVQSIDAFDEKRSSGIPDYIPRHESGSLYIVRSQSGGLETQVIPNLFLSKSIFADSSVVVDASPESIFVKRCEAFYLNGKNQEILAYVKNNLHKHSIAALDKSKILVLLARASANLNFYDDAAAYTDEALLLWKENTEALVFSSQLKLRSGDYPEALKCIKKAIYLAPDSPFVNFVYSNILLHTDSAALAKKVALQTKNLLSKFDDSKQLQYGDGLTVARLKSLASQLYEVVKR